MPTNKKRINLSVSDELYTRLQAYKNQRGITSDASACIQRMIQQLNAEDTMQMMNRLMQSMSAEQLRQIAAEGVEDWKKMMNGEK